MPTSQVARAGDPSYVPYPETIIIVDDDAEIRGSIANFLRSFGIEGRSFPDAETLLAGDGLEGASALITDVQMPGMSGLELLEHLRRKGHSLPIIVMSAFERESLEMLALKGGAQAFWPKPIDMEKFEAFLEGL